MSEPSPAPGGSAAKRPRPVISCLECRRKKLKCSRTHPCQQCIKIGRPGRCEFQTGQEPEPNANYIRSADSPNKRQRLLPPVIRDESATFLDGGQAWKLEPPTLRQGVIEDLQERVTRLEHALLAQSNGSSVVPRSPSEPSRSCDAMHHDNALLRHRHISSQFDDACTFLTKLRAGDDMAELRIELRNLHYSVEFNHHKQQGTPVPEPGFTRHPLRLPPLDICQKLAVLYFDNMEHCFRTLYWPEFRDQLSILFTQGEKACKFGYLPQLVGVLASAVLFDTHKECEAAREYVIIRPVEAIRYMKGFLQGLRENERYCLPALQVKMLFIIINWLNLTPMGELFRLNGELLRDALVMKMDRDPMTLPDISVFEGELRRRYWMTIIEVELMLSILCKMPCMVPTYTTKPPQNVNDEDIDARMQALPESRPTTEWTDELCQYLLAQSFPQRLAACKEMDTSTIIRADEVLRSTRYLEKVLQELPAPLRFNYLGDKASKSPARLMARMELDISIRRPLLHLYSQCALATDAGSSRGEVRAGLLQSCLMIANYQDLFDPSYSEIDVPQPRGYWDFFYTCYRQELGQAILGLCLEISKCASSAQEDGITRSSVVPSPAPANEGVRLIESVRDTLEPMTRRLPFRGSNVPDIVYYNVLLTSLQPAGSGNHREGNIETRLQELAHECRAELERAKVPLLAAPRTEHASDEAGHNPSYDTQNFDPLWDDFPHLDIFDTFEFNISDQAVA